MKNLNIYELNEFVNKNNIETKFNLFKEVEPGENILIDYIIVNDNHKNVIVPKVFNLQHDLESQTWSIEF